MFIKRDNKKMLETSRDIYFQDPWNSIKEETNGRKNKR